jgi:uncharacterized membrane protein YbhN (UPF0104 family)
MPPDTSPLDRTQRKVLRRIGTVASVVLVVGALAAIARNQAIVDSLSRALASPRWDALAVLAATVVAQQVLTSTTFWMLMRRHGPVGWGEMNALIASSTLANYIPLQAGSIGRLAYHKVVHGIPVKKSLVVILVAMGLVAMSLVALVVVGLWVSRAGASWWWVAVAPLAWVPLLAGPATRIVGACLMLRTVELLVIALQSWAAFRLSGWDIEPMTAVGVAVVAAVANLTPFIGNGLGVREWAVGLAAPLLGGYETDAGLAAQLTGRAVDAVMAIAMGGPALAWIASRRIAPAADAPLHSARP